EVRDQPRALEDDAEALSPEARPFRIRKARQCRRARADRPRVRHELHAQKMHQGRLARAARPLDEKVPSRGNVETRKPEQRLRPAGKPHFDVGKFKLHTGGRNIRPSPGFAPTKVGAPLRPRQPADDAMIPKRAPTCAIASRTNEKSPDRLAAIRAFVQVPGNLSAAR